MKAFFLSLILILSGTSTIWGAGFSFGALGGMEFPLWHTEYLDPGIRADAFYRTDPYEVRFHYSYLQYHYYSVVLGRKHFFSQDQLRPFIEAAIGPTIVNTPSKGLGYGATPEFSLGAEIGVNEHLSTSLVARYTAYLYFGDTRSGTMEANHSLSILAGLTFWF